MTWVLVIKRTINKQRTDTRLVVIACLTSSCYIAYALVTTEERDKQAANDARLLRAGR
jgi:hypothetical protein